MADKQHKINEDIKVDEVFLVCEEDDMKENKSLDEAKEIAESKDMDLVMVNEDGKPPVCKVMDYNKYLFELEKKNKSNTKKTKQQEMKFTPHIGEHDFNVKVNKIRKFLEKGNSAKLSVFFKGREVADTDQGKYILLKAADQLEDIGSVDKMPALDGSKMEMIIKPKKQSG